MIDPAVHPRTGGNMLGQQGHTDRPADAFRILVVDDYPDTCETMESLLKQNGYVTHIATSGREAIRDVSAFAPDLVLLDIAMPDMDGLEVAQAIHETGGIKQPLIAAMSGYSSLMYKQRCASAGFDYFLTKPVDPLAIDHLLWFERNTIRNTLRAVTQQQVQFTYDWMRSQLEFVGLMLDIAANTRNEATRKRRIEKARQQLERTATYLSSESRLFPSQMSTLQTSLKNLAVRLNAAM